MKLRLVYLWDSWRDRLWFFPLVFTLFSLLVASASLAIDQYYNQFVPELLTTTGRAGRTVLGALVGGLVTVAGLVFSITMLAVSQVSSQYGPRVIRKIFDDNVPQSTIGFLLATIVYAMMVLRSIREVEAQEGLFTPNLSITIAEVMGVACVMGLLFFTNHMTNCLRIESLVVDLYRQMMLRADAFFAYWEQFRLSSQPWHDTPATQPIQASRAGYLQGIDLTNLLSQTQQGNFRIDVLARPGDFVRQGDQLATIATSTTWTEEAAMAVESTFFIGPHRTVRQDLEAGILELVETAVRALSPGINDPRTANNVVDYLSDYLVQLSQRTWPDDIICDDQGAQRIRCRSFDFAGILNTAFNQIRQSAGSSVSVYCRLLEGLTAIAQQTRDPSVDSAVERQAQMILRQASQQIPDQEDQRDVASRWPSR